MSQSPSLPLRWLTSYLQPKYWCKHCKTYVRDTKLEKQNHDATPKHQGNLKRFLRDLHRGNEREERDKQRAKDEVARLNGTTSGSTASSTTGAKTGTSLQQPSVRLASTTEAPQATPAERKKQMARLAELGVAVPEEYRREMAMAGDWQTTSERLIYDEVKKEKDAEDAKSTGLNIGVRKRKHEGQEDEEEAGETVVQRGWGSTTRTYPGERDGEAALDILLSSTSVGQRKEPVGLGSFNTEPQPPENPSTQNGKSGSPNIPHIKHESSFEDISSIPRLGSKLDGSTVKQEEGLDNIGVMFKKRKPKAIRRK